MELSLLDIISTILGFTLLLLSAFFLTTTSENPISNKLMAVFLIIGAIDAAPFTYMDYLYEQFPGWSLLLSTTVLFKAPLIYLYVKSVIYSDLRLKKDDWLHLLPFIFVTVLFIPRFYLVDHDEKIQYLYTWFDVYNETRISYLVIHFQVLIYLIFTFLLIYKYRSILLENYSDRNQFNYKWLFSFALLYALNFFISSFKNLFLFLGSDLYSYMLASGQVLFLVFVCWIFWKALKTPTLFRGVNTDLEPIGNYLKSKNLESSSRDQESQKDIEKLSKYMEDEEPYLDPSLSLETLANYLSMYSRDLSILINYHLGKHFFDFVNGYRIEKAKQVMRNSSDEKQTILEVLYQVGFNSKSSFNTAFKKHTGMTPTQFKKSI